MTEVGLPSIHRRVGVLTRSLLDRLQGLAHRDGAPLVRLYGPTDATERGGTIPFNLLRPDGSVVGFWEVDAAAAARGISVRTGCFCNPGASETARGITADEMDRVFALGRQPSIEDLARLMPGKALGAVRVSVGIATNERDIDRFVDFLSDFSSAPTRAARVGN